MTDTISDKLKNILGRMGDKDNPLTPADFIGLTDEDIARLAMLNTLTLMMSPMSPQETSLKATRQALEFTKSKPASRVDARVSTVESWLESLSADVPAQITDASDDE